MRLVLDEPVGLLRDEQRLLVLVVRAEADRELALGRLGPQGLGLALDVVLDQRVRDREDVRGGAVVLLHQEDLGVGVVALEVQEVLDRGPAPRVDALVGVAHDADVPVLLREQVDQLVLRAVRVLVLVHEDVAEPLLVVLEDRGVVAEQPDGLGDQVVEVERPGGELALLVLHVHVRDRLLVEVARHLRELGGRQDVVLRLADRRGHRPGRVPLEIQVQVLQDAREQALGVPLVVDREARRAGRGGRARAAGSARTPNGT